jgi:hypothetical protein
MKVLVFVKATPNSEKGLPPVEQMRELFAAMGKFNDDLVKAGIMKEGDGLKPSSAGKRITFSDSGATSVIDGPFVETKELVAGYWVWEVKSMEEAVSWAKRCPNPMPGEEGVLEIRPTYTAEDFGELMPAQKPKAKAAAKKSKQAPARKKSKPSRAKSKK